MSPADGHLTTPTVAGLPEHIVSYRIVYLKRVLSCRQVIERILAVRGHTTLLVVDAEADGFLYARRLPLSGRLPFITDCQALPPSDCRQQQQQHQQGQPQRDGVDTAGKSRFLGFRFYGLSPNGLLNLHNWFPENCKFKLFFSS